MQQYKKNMKEDFEEELRNISPFLADLKKQKKEDGFKPPKYYFETLTDKVIENARPKTEVIPSYIAQPSLATRVGEWLTGLMQPRMAMAFATALFLAVGGWYFLRQTNAQQTDNCTELACLPKEEIKTYISENINEFDEEMLVGSPSIAENTEGVHHIDVFDKNANFKQLDEKEVEQYLIDNLDEKDLEN
jgi:uncharacterized protein HemX